MAKFHVISVQKGPLEQGGEYSSIWVVPTEWDDRAAPHLTRGPVPFKMGCDMSVVDTLASQPLPGFYDLEVQIKVAGGNKAQAYAVKASVLSKPEQAKAA